MTWAVYLNETELSTLGVYPESAPDWQSGPARDFQAVRIPGRQGVVLPADPETQPRVLQLACLIQPAALTLAARLRAEDLLKGLAYRALVKIIWDDGVNAPRQIDGVCTALTINPRRHPVVSLVSDATLSILCPDPTWSDVVGQMIGFSTTPVAIPLGTAPVGGIVRLAAPSWSANVTNPVLTYLSAGGQTVQTLTFTTTLSAGTDYLEIDLDRATVTDYNSGTASSGIALLTGGDFFALDPYDGDPLNSSYPMLKVTSSAGTPSGQWLGTRRWL